MLCAQSHRLGQKERAAGDLGVAKARTRFLQLNQRQGPLPVAGPLEHPGSTNAEAATGADTRDAACALCQRTRARPAHWTRNARPRNRCTALGCDVGMSTGVPRHARVETKAAARSPSAAHTSRSWASSLLARRALSAALCCSAACSPPQAGPAVTRGHRRASKDAPFESVGVGTGAASLLLLTTPRRASTLSLRCWAHTSPSRPVRRSLRWRMHRARVALEAAAAHLRNRRSAHAPQEEHQTRPRVQLAPSLG